MTMNGKQRTFVLKNLYEKAQVIATDPLLPNHLGMYFHKNDLPAMERAIQKFEKCYDYKIPEMLIVRLFDEDKAKPDNQRSQWN